MKENMNPSDTKFSEAPARRAPSPALPPRFQENVWRRIEDAEAPVKSGIVAGCAGGFDFAPAICLRHRRRAVAGGRFARHARRPQTARHDAQTRYLASVAPDSLR